jgi:phosphotransferase system HPr-like phosphotransfer protein
MHQFYVQFHSLRDVQDFVTLASSQKNRMIVGTDRFHVNATSFMSLFALNCRTPLRVTAYCSEDELEALKVVFARFLVL